MKTSRQFTQNTTKINTLIFSNNSVHLHVLFIYLKQFGYSKFWR